MLNIPKKNEVNIDEKKIDEILNRGIIINIIPEKDHFRSILLSGKKLKFYIGADPTSPVLHLSHAKNYMLLEDFRKLGHEVIVLVGDFTARIGDPTERSSARKQLSKEEVSENVKNWIKQISPLIDFNDKKNEPKVVYNNDWLSKLNFEDVVGLASNFTVQQMLERDMFEKRIKENSPIFLHEFLYPLMQGYDSVALDVDVEMCGSDQTFNALAGRTLLKRLKDKDKMIVVVNLMENPVTGEMMSKSRGTGVFLNGSADEMYGSIMSQPDEMIKILLINCTRVSLFEIEEILKQSNPRDAKMRTAFEIVKIFHGKEKAEDAQNNFIETFREGRIPEDIKEIVVEKGALLVDVLLDQKIVSSRNDFRRLIDEGAVSDMETGEKIKDFDHKIKKEIALKIGKKRFIKIKIK